VDTGDRKVKVVVIETPGRDRGKAFRITEMAALRAERWAVRAFHLIMKAGGQADGYVPGAGWEQLALAGFNSFGKIDPDVAQPLWDELLTCVSKVENPNYPDVVRPLVESDMSEVATIVQLKLEAFNIHANFSTAAGIPTSTQAAMTSPEPRSPSTPTSPQSSAPSFHPAKRPTPRQRRR
jgi:hypothetical protein